MPVKSEQQLPRLMSGVVERVVDSMKTYIDERLTVFETRQRRGCLYALAESFILAKGQNRLEGIDARLSIPKFLLEKERSDPQFASINAAFTPSEEEIAHARAIVQAFADNPGQGTIALNGNMLDRPHLALAERLLAEIGG